MGKVFFILFDWLLIEFDISYLFVTYLGYILCTLVNKTTKSIVYTFYYADKN